MKKCKRVCSLLLAVLMAFTALSVTASAAWTDYTNPRFDAYGNAYLTTDQCGSLLLDFLDDKLAEMNVNENMDLVVTKIRLNITSVDNAVKSIIDLVDNGLVGFAEGILNLKDIEDLNVAWLRRCPKRTTAGKTDLEVVYCLLHFLADNKNIVGKVVLGTFSGGLVDKFFDLNEKVGDIPAKMKDAVYNALFDSKIYGERPETMTVDTMVNNFINYMLVKDPYKDKVGMIPSVANDKLNVSSTSMYQFLRSVANGALRDIVIPMLKDMLVDMLGIVVDGAHPDGYFKGNSDMSIVWDLVFNGGPDGLINITYPAGVEGRIIPMLDYGLEYIIMGDFFKQYFVIDENGIAVKPALYDWLGGILDMVTGLLTGLNLNGVTLKSEEELAELSVPEKFNYLGKVAVIGFIDYVDIPGDVTSLREVATYFLINLCADIMPEVKFESKINYAVNKSTYSAINPATDGVLIVGASIARYYLNAVTDINLPEGLDFDATIDHIVDWAIRKYGGFICTGGMGSDNGWGKLDKFLFGQYPLLCGIFQADWLPETMDRTNLTYDLLINHLVFGILDFNLEKVFDIFTKNNTGELNKPVSTVLLNIVARLLNGVFENNEVLPCNLPNLEALFNRQTLRNVVVNLLTYLDIYAEPMFVSGLYLIVDLMGLWSAKDYQPKAPEGMDDVTVADLKALYEQQVPSNQAVEYDQKGYIYYGSEDYAVLANFYKYDEERIAANRLIKKAEEDPESVEQTELNDVYYRLTHYFSQMAKRTELDASQLYDAIIKAGNKGYNPDDFSLRSWNNYQRALAFADEVYINAKLGMLTEVSQAMISEARHQLIIAQKALKAFSPLADYTVLDAAIKAASLSETELQRYQPEEVAVLRTVLKKAKEFPRDYDISNDSDVQKMAEDLMNALNNLVFKPALAAVRNTTTVIDDSKHLIYGLREGLSNIMAYVSYVGMATVETVYTYKQNVVGTGTEVELYVDGVKTATYTVVVFGDLDGDGKADGNDAMLLNMINSGMLSMDDLTTAQRAASDADGDGGVDSLDAKTLVAAGLKKSDGAINQVRFWLPF